MQSSNRSPFIATENAVNKNAKSQKPPDFETPKDCCAQTTTCPPNFLNKPAPQSAGPVDEEEMEPLDSPARA